MADFDFKDVATMDDVPAKYQGLYQEAPAGDDGEVSFTLVDSAKGIVGDYLGTTKTLASSKNDKKLASEESAQRRHALKVFDDLAETLGLDIGDEGVADAFSALITDLQSKVKNGEEVQINMTKIRDEWQGRVDAAVADKDKEIAERDTALSRHLIGERAAVALTSANAKSSELLLPHIKGQAKVVREDNGDYSVRILDQQGDFRTAADGSWMTVTGLVEEMKTNPTFQVAFDSEDKPGTGSVPGAMKAATPRQQEEMSPTQKIAAGIAKGQHKAA